jgi:hypothetical protein
MAVMIPIEMTGVAKMIIRIANFNAHWFFFMRMGMVMSSAAMAMPVMECKNSCIRFKLFNKFLLNKASYFFVFYLPIKLTIKPRTETTSSLSCLTSGGSIALSTASEKIKNEMNSKNSPFTNPEINYKNFV